MIVQRVILAAAVVLVVKVASIQIFDTSYVDKADARTLDKQTLYPSRGLIYDRTGKLLVYNNPIYDITATVDNINPGMDTAKFCALLGISREKFEEGLTKEWSSRRYSRAVPFTFLRHVTPDRFAAFQESMHEFPGFQYVLKNVRGYRYPSAAHTLGYISEVDQGTVEEGGGIYALGDYIGATGIERTYEPLLRGVKGISYLLRDNLGREVGVIEQGKLDSAAVSGADLQITLDIDLQLLGEQLLRNKKGSIVCIEPASGEVLAMVSAPGYDPANLTIHQGRSKAFTALQQDSLKPFFDRSVMAAYAPGSIIKPIVALIAMQENVLEPDRTIYCDGAYYYRHFSYGCHQHPMPYNVTLALQYSCNAYFFQTFRDVVEKEGFLLPERGLRKFNEYMGDFGLGRPLGIDLPHEKGGNIPEVELYDNMYGKDVWRSTYIMSLGIGQGELQLTTLQMANLSAILANRGYYFTPHLIKGFLNTGGSIPAQYQEAHHVPIDARYFEPVIEGMARAVSAGTAVSAAHPRIEICGKTGTSQNPHGKDHSVFFAFAPKDNPQIAVAVYVENAGWGASWAAPIASLMIEKYLTGTVDGSRKWMENRILETNLLSKP